MKRHMPQLVVSDSRGKIYNVPFLRAVGMKGESFFKLSSVEFIKLPHGSELFMLPDRMPFAYSPDEGKIVAVDVNPFQKKEGKVFAVGAFLSPGFTINYNSAYAEIGRPKMLPLFSYGAVAFYRGQFYVTATRVDSELRQDLRYMNINSIKKGAKTLRKLFPGNRLMRHLEGCALTYGCPAAKNFFLGRYEAPLPTSPYCNAKCIGCISYQPAGKCPITQPRIKFRPSPEEVAEVALYHINRVTDPVVSFGQGCEGEPLLAGKVLEESIKLVRKKTGKGIINLNTNASRPDILDRLFHAGLDSIRVSLNSAREEYYVKYYKPRGYRFKDVLESIRAAKRRGGFVSINYLTMPGFTDRELEFKAFKSLVRKYRVDMIQWRNLNFDPVKYFQILKISPGGENMLGVKKCIGLFKKDYPGLMMGYFNPSKGRIRRHKDRFL